MIKDLPPFLVVGLGNLGAKYDGTRHNLGFMVADKLAERNGIALKNESTLKGMLGKGKIGSAECFLLKPTTFMNLSGEAVVLVRQYYKVPVDQILVISDEVALPFGKMRLSEKGSNGGHRGLESVELMLGTQHYARLRIGVGDREVGELSDHVLGKFEGEQKTALSQLIEQAVIAVETWVARKAAPVNNDNNKGVV